MPCTMVTSPFSNNRSRAFQKLEARLILCQSQEQVLFHTGGICYEAQALVLSRLPCCLSHAHIVILRL